MQCAAGALPSAAIAGSSSVIKRPFYHHAGVIRGMYQPREICGKERSVVNKKTNQHLEAEQTDSREGPRPPGMLDHKQNPSTCLEAKIEAVCRADHWG